MLALAITLLLDVPVFTFTIVRHVCRCSTLQLIDVPVFTFTGVRRAVSEATLED